MFTVPPALSGSMILPLIKGLGLESTPGGKSSLKLHSRLVTYSPTGSAGMLYVVLLVTALVPNGINAPDKLVW